MESDAQENLNLFYFSPHGKIQTVYWHKQEINCCKPWGEVGGSKVYRQNCSVSQSPDSKALWTPRITCLQRRKYSILILDLLLFIIGGKYL